MLKKCLIFLTSLLFGALSAQNIPTYKWSNVKMGGGGFVSGILACPSQQNLFYARTDVGGAYRWEESTQKWIPLLDWVSENEKALLGVESMAIDPQSPNNLYITAGLSGYGWSGAAFLRSDDYGETFEKIPLSFYIHGNGMGRQTGEKLAVDPNDGNIIFMGTRKNGMQKSTDRGKTWKQLSSYPLTTTTNLNGVSFVVLDKNSAVAGQATQIIYSGASKAGSNVFVSKDGGDSWNPIPDAPTLKDIMPHRAVLSSDGSMLYVTYANGAGPHAQTWSGVNDPMDKGAVYRYNTLSGEWTNISPIDLLINPLTNGCFGGISVDGGNDDRLVCSTINQWSQRQRYVDGSEAWGDRIFVSENGGDSWQAMFEGSKAMRLDNNGINWISGHNLHWVGSITLDPFNGNRLFASSGNGIFMSDNFSTSNASIMKFTVNGIEETVPLDMVSVPDGPFVSVVADYDGWIHQDVHKFPFGKRHTPTMGTTSGIAYSPQNTSVLVRAGSSGKVLYYSLNSGSTWTPFTNLPGEHKNGKVAVASKGQTHITVWIPAETSDKLYVSTDLGITWRNIWESTYGSLRNAHPYADPIQSSTFYIYVSSKGKVYHCDIPETGEAAITSLADVGTNGSGQLAIHPSKTADFWVALGSSGLKHYNNGSLETVTNIQAKAVTLGKAKANSAHPTLYVWGTYNSQKGLFMSNDMALSWQRINDDAHEYGGLGNGNMILGDNNVYGRVYMTTAGRGITMGEMDATNNLRNVINPTYSQLRPIPNPFALTTEIFNAGTGACQIYDVTGKLIECHSFTNTLVIGHGWKSGVYILNIQNEKGKQYLKVIKN